MKGFIIYREHEHDGVKQDSDRRRKSGNNFNKFLSILITFFISIFC